MCPSPTSSSLYRRYLRPEPVDDQFREPLRPVFLFQLLFCQIVSELWSHLELRDQKRDHIVGPDLLDEAVGRSVRVLRLRLPLGRVVVEQRGQARVLEVLELLLSQRHSYCQSTIRVVQPAAKNPATSCTTQSPIAQPQ